MASRYAIGPSIGVARLGNSPDDFYLEPDAIAALPIECDKQGNVVHDGGRPRRVTQFKDPQGRVKRQGAYFRVFRIDDSQPGGVEVTLDDPDVASMQWTVHLANKKACWYNFAELEGNLLYGEQNSYGNKDVPLRNADKQGTTARRELIIDPGPRSLSGRTQRTTFGKDTVPPSYEFASFPRPVTIGDQITTLGDMLTDQAGRLIVLGGFGRSGGDQPISSFAGANTWHDDISDGPVSCSITFKNGTAIELEAWCVVGSPKFAPEIANVVTLDDTMYDVAVRHFETEPSMYSGGAYNPTYVANFERDIKPILERPAAYRWVANVPSMNSLSPPMFDARDTSTANAPLRQAYFALFREPSPENAISAASNTLFAPGGFPLMPLNSGSNSVSNTMIDKFLTLTQTQYFLLGQWAAGKFSVTAPPPVDTVTALSRGSVGNCVGGPFCPGIEVTWSTRNPNIYNGALRIRHRHPQQWYDAHGLNPDEDETAAPLGCEPGDLTKRMAIPWQADFFQCSVQYINFTDPNINKSDGIPTPPTYYAYWWPPQSPWVVITGDETAALQSAAGTPAGFQVLYTRGINTFGQMISSWHYMGFILNRTSSEFREVFPYFTEQERDHGAFVAAAVAVGDASNVVSGTDQNFSNVWFMVPPPPSQAPGHGPATPAAVSFASARRHGRQALRDD
ncbi:hypothetical protein GWC77_04065 [Paraburkholderia sp. NMBU_R16]|uniref:CTQ-dependent lysine 6-oxidase LodA n=1 Tax=Paraburkholderia sp. NMBU_R16 TaxID=2698676 RepID=UPI00156707D5|nr:CTQ-dependent lysine 6-oxidase LodA [Paraburkholderia sp. NMBU_R16]NRO95117.1 hypothetical protein [Paraburkholderia sp. NMBU_R16]